MPLFLSVGRIEARQIGSYPIQVGLSLLQRNTRFEPGKYAPMDGAALPRFRRRSKGQRCPQVESVFERRNPKLYSPTRKSRGSTPTTV